MIVGYARTSTMDQKAGLDAQVRDLEAAGCGKIFSEQISSTKAERPKLAECLRFCREGDVLAVTKPDRLARNTRELLSIEADLTQRGVGLVIQSMGLDTRNGSNPTARLMLSVLGAVATWEREIMRERQLEGIAKAKAEGRYKGRPPSLDRATIRRMKAEGIGPAAIAAKLRVARSSVYRILEAAEP
jgi:DNA invertase Pin-like site-specific DNA recombinase